MAVVLCVGTDDVLMTTRKLILERAGHEVISIQDPATLARACKEQPVAVAVLGQNMERAQKTRAFSLIRSNCPKAKVLSLHRAATGRLLPDADDWLEVPLDVPADLADRVSNLARSG